MDLKKVSHAIAFLQEHEIATTEDLQSHFRDMLIPDGIPAIVPVELFDKVQARMELNAKAPARKKAKEALVRAFPQ